MQLIIVGLSLAAIIFAWNYAWRRALLDTTRDRLFDIRDGSRQWFLDQGYSLDNPAYIALRTMLNSHLWHTEDATLSSFILFIIAERLTPNTTNKLSKHIINLYRTNDNKIDMFVNNARQEAANAMFGYMVFRNIFFTSFFIFISILCFIVVILKSLYTMICNFVFSRRPLMAATASLMITFFSLLNYGGIINNRMEKYSLTPNSGAARMYTMCIFRNRV